jgi:beta-amylase
VITALITDALPAEYGRFFLSWYSGLLIQHADLLLGAARQVLSARCRPRAMREARELSDGGMLYVFGPAVQLGIKLAGVHWWACGCLLLPPIGCIILLHITGAWQAACSMSNSSHSVSSCCSCLCLCRWFKSRAHAAELTAGYYNTRERNGYLPIFEMLKRHGAAASFTCVEMRDCEHPIEGRCSPEGLLNQVHNFVGGEGQSPLAHVRCPILLPCCWQLRCLV